jgi:ribonuclease Z
MPKLIILGTATNVPDETHENTHMVLVSKNRMVLIDGPGNPYSRLLQAKLNVDHLTDIVMTHFHPDHVGGIPLLLMAFGLSGRKAPINIYANQHCMDFMQQLLVAFEWENWHSYPVNFVLLPEKDLYPVIDENEFQIFSSPVKHFIPALGLRIAFKSSGKALAYTGDTAPTENLLDLAHEADVLIHEAAGESAGHSSALQAGLLANKAKVGKLILIHYPVGKFHYQDLVSEAAQAFSGKIVMAEDFDVLDFRE